MSVFGGQDLESGEEKDKKERIRVSKEKETKDPCLC